MAARILNLIVFTFALSGCVTVATTAAVSGASIAAQDKSVSDTSSDYRIRLLADDKLFKYNVDLWRAVDMDITEGRVLLVGNVAKPEDRVKATELVWQVPGVREVLNELQVRNDTGIGNYTRDSWIVAKLRTRMVFEKDVISINYSVDCVNGVVYLMGIAQDDAELRRVQRLARGLGGVKDVVSYVRLKYNLPNPLPVNRPTAS